jgi:hypothetical protein
MVLVKYHAPKELGPGNVLRTLKGNCVPQPFSLEGMQASCKIMIIDELAAVGTSLRSTGSGEGLRNHLLP